jgi:hypothetical protein
VAHLFECGANGDGVLRVEEQTPNFGFGGGGGNGAECFAKDVDGSIGIGLRR